MNDVDSELDILETERSRADLADLDTRDTRAIVEQIAADDATVAGAVAAASAEIATAVDAITARLRSGGRLIYVGAGTPGRLAALDAAECPPTFGTDPDTVLAVMAGGADAMTSAIEGVEDDTDQGVVDLAGTAAGAGDAVVGITASGRTPYVLAAIDEANRRGCLTIGISNNPGTRISGRVDVAVETPTGPEVVAGSTRMKAGTAQKLVLNTLSTATMIALGKTYGNLMVDVAATNAKLRSRARNIVAEATGVPGDTAAATLEQAGGSVPTAIVALLSGTDVATAAQRLGDSGGDVRAALRVEVPE